MSSKLKKFLLLSNVVLILIHIAYFAYGFIHFPGVKNINIYTEFYRFKFYDEVSISHFFIAGLFLLITLILLIRNHSRVHYSVKQLLLIGGVLLLTVANSLTFFMSYSFGMNASLKNELPEKKLNADKTLLNVLNSFLYPVGAYNSESMFKVTNILYPDPYPIIEEQDTPFYDPANKESFTVQTVYYSIDTLKLAEKSFDKMKKSADTISSLLGFGKAELANRIISQKTENDSTVIIYKGREVNPQYDDSVCVFLETNNLISPINGIDIKMQQQQNAVKRYNLLYRAPSDSLLRAFKSLDTLLKNYKIESYLQPAALIKDVYHIRDGNQQSVIEMQNRFERNQLIDKIKTLDRLFYQPAFFHSSIRPIFFCVLLGTWLFGFLIFVIVNYRRRAKL
ncbi:hypothetical protein [Pedobacter frigidisoli]|uniref:hypothetical protein n=1 Tax=Pedobacter frigidisoli TaxID=2530455 RepID=UPI00292D7BB2|nr:hypothetical protein [Pedobacter frigidisoli]